MSYHAEFLVKNHSRHIQYVFLVNLNFIRLALEKGYDEVLIRYCVIFLLRNFLFEGVRNEVVPSINATDSGFFPKG